MANARTKLRRRVQTLTQLLDRQRNGHTNHTGETTEIMDTQTNAQGEMFKPVTPAAKLKRNVLDLKTYYLLTNYVKDNYIPSKLNDTEFAKQANKALGINVNPWHIAEARKTLEMPSNYAVTVKAKAAKAGYNVEEMEAMKACVDALEARITTLEEDLNVMKKLVLNLTRDKVS